MLDIDADQYLVGTFVAIGGGAFIVAPSLRSLLRLPLFFATLLLMAQIVRRVFRLTPNVAAATEFFKGFRVGGHRGSPILAPENTIESFEKAKMSDMDLVEFDLTLTKDGIAVIMHDDDLLRTCGEPGLVASFTLEELGTKNAGKTFRSDTVSKVYRIPTLEATVKYCSENNLKMLFDVKDSSHEMVSQIVSMISSNNLYDRVIVSSFFPWVSLRVKFADPKILTGITWRPYFFSYEDLECRTPRFSGFKHFLALLLDYMNMKLLHSILPQMLGVEMLLIYEKEVSAGLVKKMKSLDIEVVAWTVNDPYQMLYLVDSLRVPFLTDMPHVYDGLKELRMKMKNKASGIDLQTTP